MGKHRAEKKSEIAQFRWPCKFSTLTFVQNFAWPGPKPTHLRQRTIKPSLVSFSDVEKQVHINPRTHTPTTIGETRLYIFNGSESFARINEIYIYMCICRYIAAIRRQSQTHTRPAISKFFLSGCLRLVAPAYEKF